MGGLVPRNVVVASQLVQRFAAHVARLRFAIECHGSAEALRRGPRGCLILAPMHKTMLDPWLIANALGHREWRSLAPVRFLATTTFGPPLKWILPLIRVFYALTGGVPLPPKEEAGTLAEKVQGLLAALRQGEVVLIFPEGGLWTKRDPPVGPFAQGAVYLQRESRAPIVPMALWIEAPGKSRRRYVVEIGDPLHVPPSLDLEAGAGWLQQRMVALYDRAARAAEGP